MLNLPSYVLITPARNEAKYIEMTIKSVVAQTVRRLSGYCERRLNRRHG